MSGVVLEVTSQGLTQTELLLGTLHRKLGSLHPLMLRFGAYLESSVEQRFATETGPDGKKWTPSVRAQATGGQTLTGITRQLRSSITSNADERSVAVGTNVKYAASHQFGRDKPEPVAAHNRLIHEAFGKPLKFGVWQSVREHQRNPNIPARPFIGLDYEDIAELQGRTIDYMGSVMSQVAA